MRPLSVVIIAKNCAVGLDKCLASLRPSFLIDSDELLVLDTGCKDDGATLAVAERHGARVVPAHDLCRDLTPLVDLYCPEHAAFLQTSPLASGCLLDFAAARNRAAASARYDLQFWIDSDDELVEAEPGALRKIIDRDSGKDEVTTLFLDYVYAHDQHDASVSSILKRERIYDRRRYEWVGRCHETCIPRPGCDIGRAAYYQDLKSYIRHNKVHNDTLNPSDLRNFIILRNELAAQDPASKDIDPRTVFYLANACRGIRRDMEAHRLYQAFIPRSGSRDDRYAAAYYCGLILIGQTHLQPVVALDHFFHCIRLKPEDPRGYFGLSRAYFLMGKSQEALHWFRVGRTLPEPTECLHNYDPRHIHVLPLQIAASAAQALGLVDEALHFLDQLKRAAPNHPETKHVEAVITNWVAGQELIESVRRVVANSQPPNAAAAREVGRKVVASLTNVPPELEDMGLLPIEPADPRPARPSLVFFCGRAIESWGPKSGEDGIGGSEKAVIQMAGRMQARGWNVTVYTNVPRAQRGQDQKHVLWRHSAEFDFSRPRDVIVFWRAPELLELPVPCKRRILWCHDVQNPTAWNEARCALADEVWMLSDFHVTTLGPWLPALKDKVWVTRNGIDSGLFEKLRSRNQPRDNLRVAYVSSPDRGLLTAIDVFQKAEVPQSTLDVYYGFNKVFMENAKTHEYVHVADLDRTCNLYEYMRTVYKRTNRDNRIRLHGRVGWDRLAAELTQTGVWLYPTRFDEISCMAAMEAQAAGCIPVASRHAALAQTVLHGPEVSAEDPTTAAKTLAYAMREPTIDRAILSRLACERFSYETLANDWDTRLKQMLTGPAEPQRRQRTPDRLTLSGRT